MKKILLTLLISMLSLFAFEELNYDNFDKKIANKSVIIDFHATYWGACQALGKSLQKYDSSKTSDVTIYKVDINAQAKLAKRLNIRSMPTLVYSKNGKFIAIERGVVSAETIKQNVQKYLK